MHGNRQHARESLGETVFFGVDDKVDFALAVQQHIFRAVLGDGAESHLLEQHPERRGIRSGVFDEFETVGLKRIFPERGTGRCHRSFSCEFVVARYSMKHSIRAYCRTMFTPPSFSCASRSDATYLSPKPRILALTML